jgi:F0F1-type ATP synthase assembly protein I
MLLARMPQPFLAEEHDERKMRKRTRKQEKVKERGEERKDEKNLRQKGKKYRYTKAIKMK